MSLNGSYFASLALFSSYYFGGNALEISSVFASIQLIEFIRFNGIGFVGVGIAIYYELKVIMSRIIEILKVEE